MKKVFIGAAAMIIALASCSKISVVNNDAPQEIGLRAIAGTMTKAPITAFGEGTNMGVYADYKGAATGSVYQAYFADFEFHNNEGSWVGWNGTAHSPKYYPVSGTLDFFAYSPKCTAITAGRDGVTGLTFAYTLASNKTNQYDVLVSEIRSGVTKPNAATDVAMKFKHALSLIDINVKKTGTADIVVKSITLTGTNHAGTATVTYDANRVNETFPTISWVATDALGSDLINTVLTLGDDFSDYNTSADLLVVPTTGVEKSMTIVYTIDGGIDLSHTFSLGDTGNWAPSTKYTYNITVGPLEITINPSITEWTSATTSNPTI
ncbi:MAG: fimbrillin family protein [Bacteroidales bacterium]|nr:fimbrillin family protein [Bacteroidales bacterium]